VRAFTERTRDGGKMPEEVEYPSLMGHTGKGGGGQDHFIAYDGIAPADSPVDPVPDGPRYAAMGDAVTVNVIEWIGLRILSAGDGTIRA
jgi:hypothetical protein